MTDIICNSAIKLAKAIYDKDLSSQEVINEYLKQIEEINPKLNAIVQLTADEAIREAKEADKLLAKGKIKGPLHGVPMTIKDSLDTSGVITTWGIPV